MKKNIIYLVAIFILAIFLRFYKLGQVPVGLYIDEVSIGVNADSILKKGVDEYGRRYPLWFEAFGEYKLPVYIYLTGLSMFFFGKNEWAVRFPSAFFGSLTIAIAYLLIKEFDQTGKKALLSAFLLSVSTWHLHLSRAGFETNIGLFFFILASWQAVLFWRVKKIKFLAASFFCYALTLYTYNSYRIITPMVVGFLTISLLKKFTEKRKQIVLIAFFFLLLCLPAVKFSLSGKGNERFKQTSAFIEYPDRNFQQKVKIYPQVFLKNFLNHFSPVFLFYFGDGITRHQLRDFGVLSRWQLPFLFLGVLVLIKSRTNILSKLIILLALIASIPASFARPCPHSLRSFLLIIPLIMTISLGLEYLFANLSRAKKLIAFIFTLLVAFYESGFYLHYYYVHYPKTDIIGWGGGYKQLVAKVTGYRNNYDIIAANKNLGYPDLYFRFYNDDLNPIVIEPGWQKPKELQDKKILYITDPIDKPSDTFVEAVYLDNLNKDIFANLWQI